MDIDKTTRLNPITELLTTTIQDLTKQKEYHEKNLNDINEKIESHNKTLKLIEDAGKNAIR